MLILKTGLNETMFIEANTFKKDFNPFGSEADMSHPIYQVEGILVSLKYFFSLSCMGRYFAYSVS